MFNKVCYLSYWSFKLCLLTTDCSKTSEVPWDIFLAFRQTLHLNLTKDKTLVETLGQSVPLVWLLSLVGEGVAMCAGRAGCIVDYRPSGVLSYLRSYHWTRVNTTFITVFWFWNVPTPKKICLNIGDERKANLEGKLYHGFNYCITHHCLLLFQ